MSVPHVVGKRKWKQSAFEQVKVARRARAVRAPPEGRSCDGLSEGRLAEEREPEAAVTGDGGTEHRTRVAQCGRSHTFADTADGDRGRTSDQSECVDKSLLDPAWRRMIPAQGLPGPPQPPRCIGFTDRRREAIRKE